MSLTTRAKNILLSPKSEWAAISGETDTPQSLLGKYVIPMALIPAIALFIGYGLIGYNVLGIRIGGGIRWGVIMGLNNFIGSIIAYFLCTYVVDALAPSFSSAKNIGRSAQLVAYSYTAVWVAGIFYIIPSLSILLILGLYSIYLFYLGIPAMKGTPEDKQVTYMIVSAIVIIVIGFVVNMIITRIVFAVTGNPFLGAGGIDIHL
ncbi:MAG TPA: Yip1 family protein [Puia sp.]|nr:Yip1 family protein [Puia sp.]